MGKPSVNLVALNPPAVAAEWNPGIRCRRGPACSLTGATPISCRFSFS